ncbi:MAG: GNAT family N-acetyltransferase [Bacteroidota bacterium]
MEIQRVPPNHPDFIQLVTELDAGLAISDGEDHAFYDQFNKLDNIKYVVLAFLNEQAVGCGAIKAFDAATMEVKRMYVRPQHRGKGIATQTLSALEAWAVELGASRCILETGHKQPEAIALYHKCEYQIISNYGQYAGVANSVCFEKRIA